MKLFNWTKTRKGKPAPVLWQINGYWKDGAEVIELVLTKPHPDGDRKITVSMNLDETIHFYGQLQHAMDNAAWSAIEIEKLRK